MPELEAPAEWAKIGRAFAMQEQSCLRLDSPFTARLCRLFSLRVPSELRIAERLANWPGDATYLTDAVPLRMTGALHALVIEGLDAKLTGFYPPYEAPADDDRLWREIDRALSDHADFVLDRLESPPQTNEVRRSVAILPGLAVIAERFGLPLNLLEVGASGGLNLVCDRYAYTLGGRSYGEASSPVKLAPDWEGPPPPAVEPRVAARAGCDLRPFDLRRDADRKRLLSYIWADQPERIERTRAAMEIAAEHAPVIQRADAISWLDQRLAARPEGLATVLFHSIAWQYFPAEAQERGARLMEDAGREATSGKPLAWLAMEADPSKVGAALTLRTWPGDGTDTGPIELARVDFHGRWVRWSG